MYVALVLAVSVLLATFMGKVASQNHDLAARYLSRTQYMQVVGLAENIEQYFVENNAFPASMADLSASAGFEQSRALTNSWQGYAVSPVLTDSMWQYQRAVLISNDPSKGVSAANYLAGNTCGAGGYDTAASWCGTATGKWFRRETRERYAEQITTERTRLNRLRNKLGAYYNLNFTFPDKTAGGAALAADSINTVASLAGFGGTAATCSGTFSYMGVPVDCGDMYDRWGQAVGYQFVSAKHIILVSETPIFNSTGNRVVVASDFDNSLL